VSKSITEIISYPSGGKMKILFMILILLLTTQIYTQTDYSKELEIGIDLFNQEKFERAREIFETIINDNDDLSEAHYYLQNVFSILEN
jgi:hypothetical protein